MRCFIAYRIFPKASLRQIFASTLALALSSTGMALAGGACPAGTAIASDGTCASRLQLQYEPQMYLGAPGTTVTLSPTDDAEPLPFAVTPSGDGVAVRTGISTLKDYNAKILSKKIERAKATASPNTKLPDSKPAAKPKFDIWSSVTAPNQATSDGQAVRASVGADYLINPNTKTGIVAERADPTITPGSSTVTSGDEKLSAYVNFKASPVLSVDAKSEWQRTQNFNITGDTLTEKSIVSIAPKLNKKYDLKNGQTIEPYATVRHELDLNTTEIGTPTHQNSVGAGVTFAMPESYSMTISTDLEGVGAGSSASTNTKLQFKMPLP